MYHFPLFAVVFIFVFVETCGTKAKMKATTKSTGENDDAGPARSRHR